MPAPEKQATIIPPASGDVPWDMGLAMLAEKLADAWVKHCYEPGKGTVEAYVKARTDIVRQFYPAHPPFPAETKCKSREVI